MNIGLNAYNDIYVENGDLPLVTGLEEIRQMTGQILRSFQGDWFLDLELGVPYFQTLFRKVTTLSDIEGIYLGIISAIPGVLDITRFDLEFTKGSRTLNIVFTAVTTDGILNFNLAGV